MITPDEAIKAQAASDEVERCMRHGIEPFGCVGWDKLEEAISFSLSPIRALKHVSMA